MQDLIPFIANGLAIAGAILLAVAMVPTGRLFQRISAGSLRSQWGFLILLILFFLSGYIAYVALNWNAQTSLSDLVTPAVFFFGALFVLMVCSLALNTADQIMQVRTLQEETIADPLMGIYNRRYLERRLREEVSRCKRYGLPLSMLLLDIDHFKRVNDTHGHLVGDLVLQELGKLVVSSLRESDIVARYGGEEILVLLPNTKIHAAAVVAERLRRIVEQFEIPINSAEGRDQGTVRVTVSIGVAGFNQEPLDPQDLIEKVDRSLYQAKESGRNRVGVSEEIADQAHPDGEFDGK